MKRLILIITLFTLFLNCASAAEIKTVTKDYNVVAADKFTISAKLVYPKQKNVMNYKTVVLLHSLGYNSNWWSTLPDELLQKGYAVLFIDFRGHGESIYNSKLARVSYTSLTRHAYAKYPDDVLTVIDTIKKENKRTFFNDWAIVGCDVGSATAIHVANKISYKPKTIVMISPVVEYKGLYVPVKYAELNNIDVLAITGSNDVTGEKANKYLKRFAQSTYAEYSADSKLVGMLMFKKDETLPKFIASWIYQYLN